MVKTLRATLLKFGVPTRLLKSFEQAVEEGITSKFRRMLDSEEQRSMGWSEESSIWRLKYMQEHKKAQELELLIGVKEEKIKQQRSVIGKLSSFVKWLRTQVFGETSERGASQPVSEPMETPATATASSKAKPKRGKKKGAPGHGRDRDAGMAQPVEHDLEEKDKVCHCGGDFELTDLTPVSSYETHLEENVVVREHLRRKALRRCRNCGRCAGIKTANKPGKLIPKGKYSPEFWRFILEEKYWLQRPHNRVITKLKSLGAKVRAGTINSGLRRLHDKRIFEVVYEAIVHRSRIAEMRNMDDTGWKVFPESDSERCSHWYMWVAVTVDTTVFILDARRSNEVIAEHLKGIAQGIIVCDRHSSFKCFGKNNEGFLIAFCWVHQRRDIIKLRDGYPEHAQWAQEWLVRIEALRAQNEVRVQSLGSPEQFKVQDIILREMVAQMKKTIDTQLKDKSLAKERVDELTSLATHWTGLTVFVDHPYVPMDNNAAERALREAVLGRKCYYGSRSEWSGKLTSHLFTIYATLEQNGVNPHTWMGEYLNTCAKNDGLPPPDKVLERFLPWNYKQAASAPPATPDQPENIAPDTRTSPNKSELLTVSVLHEPVTTTSGTPP